MMTRRTKDKYETSISNLQRANAYLIEQRNACLRRLEGVGYNTKSVCCPSCGSKDLSSCKGGEYYHCRKCDDYVNYDPSLDRYSVRCGNFSWRYVVNRYLEQNERKEGLQMTGKQMGENNAKGSQEHSAENIIKMTIEYQEQQLVEAQKKLDLSISQLDSVRGQIQAHNDRIKYLRKEIESYKVKSPKN